MAMRWFIMLAKSMPSRAILIQVLLAIIRPIIPGSRFLRFLMLFITAVPWPAMAPISTVFAVITPQRSGATILCPMSGTMSVWLIYQHLSMFMRGVLWCTPTRRAREIIFLLPPAIPMAPTIANSGVIRPPTTPGRGWPMRHLYFTIKVNWYGPAAGIIFMLFLARLILLPATILLVIHGKFCLQRLCGAEMLMPRLLLRGTRFTWGVEQKRIWEFTQFQLIPGICVTEIFNLRLMEVLCGLMIRSICFTGTIPRAFGNILFPKRNG